MNRYPSGRRHPTGPRRWNVATSPTGQSTVTCGGARFGITAKKGTGWFCVPPDKRCQECGQPTSAPSGRGKATRRKHLAVLPGLSCQAAVPETPGAPGTSEERDRLVQQRLLQHILIHLRVLRRAVLNTLRRVSPGEKSDWKEGHADRARPKTREAMEFRSGDLPRCRATTERLESGLALKPGDLWGCLLECSPPISSR